MISFKNGVKDTSIPMLILDRIKKNGVSNSYSLDIQVLVLNTVKLFKINS